MRAPAFPIQQRPLSVSPKTIYWSIVLIPCELNELLAVACLMTALAIRRMFFFLDIANFRVEKPAGLEEKMNKTFSSQRSRIPIKTNRNQSQELSHYGPLALNIEIN